MTLEANKQVVRAFLKATSWHDGDTVDAMLTPDATYWVEGLPRLFAAAGTQSREQICRYMRTPSIFSGGIRQTIGEVTAEADRVAAEMAFEGTLPDGRVYRCTYHYLFRLRDGKIAAVKEYLDTAAAIEFFG